MSSFLKVNNYIHNMSFKVTKRLKLILFGMLLGDANLQTFSKGKTVRLRVLHGEKQKAYVKHKYQLFKPIIRTQMLRLCPKEKKGSKLRSKRYYFNTICTNKLTFFWHCFYSPDGKKKLPKLIHRYIEPISLAYWYMDDGSLKWKNRSKAVRLCTDNFSKQEVLHLVEILNSKFQLNASLFKQRSRFRIYIPNGHYEFSRLIQPYVVDSLLYKVPMGIV
jgi:hypothetical protein